MNWLAHVFLSKPDIEFRLGNLLADLVKGKDREAMSPAFQEGIKQHLLIDRFTDTHPIVSRSRARIRGDFPHATGILIDIFYDHFLAINWNNYSSESFTDYNNRFYQEVRACPIELPEFARMAVDHIIETDRFGSYQHLDGIEDTLKRLSRRLTLRLGKDLELHRGMSDLVANYDDLRSDFTEFFPQLRSSINF